MMMRMILTVVLGFCLQANLAIAKEDAWDDIKSALYADHFLIDGSEFIDIHAPRRAEDDSRAVIGATIALPAGDLIKSIDVILDNNPAPVSATFTLAQPVGQFAFDATMRVNGPTPLHITVETDAGKVFVAESYVKTSGLGACSAPPGTDPDEALATLGEMLIEFEQRDSRLAVNSDGVYPLPEAGSDTKARVQVSHPSHSGMQMDQITLLFVPMRTVQTLDVEQNGQAFMNVEGSISLSENPELSFSVPANTVELGVTMTDTDGAVTTEIKRRSLH